MIKEVNLKMGESFIKTNLSALHWTNSGMFEGLMSVLHTLLVWAKQTLHSSLLYLRRVEMVDALAPLLPRDALLALPDRVHVAVVHALAQQVLLELEAAGP